jgi:hypothetical protein
MCRVWVGGMDCEFRGKINGIWEKKEPWPCATRPVCLPKPLLSL